MFSYSDKSLNNLHTCHSDIIRLFRSVIKMNDCSIISGHRAAKEQLNLFCKGRLSSGDIVTYKDGFNQLSVHQSFPSLAVDVVPYPSGWSDISLFYSFSAGVKKCAFDLNIPIKWGGDWVHFKDYAHWYLNL